MDRNSFLIVSKEVLADKRISATAKLLLAQLEDHRNKRTGQCNPRETTLAKELGISRRSVIRSLIELKSAELIVMKRTQRGNLYEIPKCQNGTSHVTDSDFPKCQNGTSGAGASLYEPYLREGKRPRAEARSRRPPPQGPTSNTPQPCAVPRKEPGLAGLFDPLNGKFLSKAEWQQLGWAMVFEEQKEYERRDLQKEAEQQRRQAGGR